MVAVPFQQCQYLVQDVACGKTPYCQAQFSVVTGCSICLFGSCCVKALATVDLLLVWVSFVDREKLVSWLAGLLAVSASYATQRKAMSVYSWLVRKIKACDDY